MPLRPTMFDNQRMAKSQPDISQPLDVRVNPRRWTTKVNIAMVVSVIVIGLIGGAYALYAYLNPKEVRQDVQEQVESGP